MKNIYLLTGLLPLLFSCNLYQGIDSPSGDEQLISAARGCLDAGKFDCAKDYYQQLSNSSEDIKLSELALTQLAQDDVFSISDLISTLGSGRGDGNTFTLLANMVSLRGKSSSGIRTRIQKAYADASQIQDPSLRGYIRFVTSLAMFNNILAYAAGNGNELKANDLAQNAQACVSAGTACASFPTPAAACNAPTTGRLASTSGTVPTNLNTAANWDAEPTLVHLEKAAAAADAASQEMTGSSSSSGILAAMSEMGNLPGADHCKRQVIVKTLFKDLNP